MSPPSHRDGRSGDAGRDAGQGACGVIWAIIIAVLCKSDMAVPRPENGLVEDGMMPCGRPARRRSVRSGHRSGFACSGGQRRLCRDCRPTCRNRAIAVTLVICAAPPSFVHDTGKAEAARFAAVCASPQMPTAAHDGRLWRNGHNGVWIRRPANGHPWRGTSGDGPRSDRRGPCPPARRASRRFPCRPWRSPRRGRAVRRPSVRE